MSTFDEASLVFIPSGYKTSKAYSVKPSDGSGDLTFTRSNDTATRVGPDGLIEKVRTNLFLYSEQFNNTAAWQYQGSPIISANASVAPDGTTTADLLYPSVNGSVVAAIQSITSASSVEYTQSVYVKASGKNFVALYTFNGTTGTAMWVNLTTGAITNGVGANVSNRFATNVGNGWWRIGFTDIGNGTTTYMHVYPTDAASSSSVTASGTDGILLWGAQLETGVTTDYIATTTAAVSVGPVANVPRLDYLNSSCPRLLLEGQRTSLITFSEQTNNAVWTKRNSTISANSATSPDGYTNADKIQEDTTNDRHDIYQEFSVTSGTAYTISAFVKAAERTFCFLSFGSSNVNASNAFFNLSTGAVVSSPAGVTSTITSYGNGWYRITSTATASGTGLAYVVNGPTLNASGISYQGVSGSGILVYGYGAEAGAYATSYIPTLGSASTRGSDAASKTGISSLIGQTEGTLFVDLSDVNDLDFPEITIDNNNNTDRIVLTRSAAGNWGFFVASSAASTFSAYSTVSSTSGKFALAYSSAGYALYRNGVQIVTGTYDLPVALSAIRFNGRSSSDFFASKCVKQAIIFPNRLSAADLAALTA